MTSPAVREAFAAASAGFVAVVSEMGAGVWDSPGLGEWTVRDLVGHASRSFTTIETYLAEAAADPPREIAVRQPLDYLMGLQNPMLDPAAIVQRGRDAGAALGPDPAAAVQALARRVAALVESTPDDAVVRTLFGGALFGAYLPTRTFELTVHTLDLAGALGVAAPAILDGPTAACLQLAAAVAATRGDAAPVLLALTGRRPLPERFSVV